MRPITVATEAGKGVDLTLADPYPVWKERLKHGGKVKLVGISAADPHPGVQMLQMWGCEVDEQDAPGRAVPAGELVQLRGDE